MAELLQGSVFVEFGYKADLEKFVARESYPKFQTGESAEDMVVMTKCVALQTLQAQADDREAYVEMKAKEHGVDPKEWKNKSGANKFDRKKNDQGKKWNAFNEMDKLKHGKLPDMAKIPEGVDIVGKPITSSGSQAENKKKRQREDEDEEKSAKQSKPNVC